MKTAAVILAGGASSRMGFPKALLTLGDVTFADQLIGLFRDGCEQTILVIGYEAERVRRGIRETVDFAVNPSPARGMLSSLQCGLAEVRSQIEGVFFTPVDMPLIQPATLVRLIEGFSGGMTIVPEHAGRHGHPVLMPAKLIPEFLAADPNDSSASEILHRHPIRYLPVDDPGVITNINSPDAYMHLMAEARA